jgi:DNA-binding PadR family transcriptional regulator
MELREATYYVLAGLLEGPRHGYGIAQAASELSEDRVRLSAGTIYGALDRLTAEGLVAPAGEEVVAGRLRRYYRLTGEGRTALAAEAARLRSSAEVVESRLDASPAIAPSGGVA